MRRPDRTARQDAALAAAASALVGGLLVGTSAGHRGSMAAVTAAVVAGCLVGLALHSGHIALTGSSLGLHG